MKLDKLFKNKDYLNLALTHKSWVNEHSGVRESNERLEFLGDAVLEFVVSERLFREFPGQEEGYLTALRANLVNTVNLAGLATRLELGSTIYLSRGEEEGGGRTNPSLLADCVEAIIGALFLDSGLPRVSSFLEETLFPQIQEFASGVLKDPKSVLQEIVQAKGLAAPRYNVVGETGPDHAKEFVIGVLIDGEMKGTGTGKSKGEAEQEAAKAALSKVSPDVLQFRNAKNKAGKGGFNE